MGVGEGRGCGLRVGVLQQRVGGRWLTAGQQAAGSQLLLGGWRLGRQGGGVGCASVCAPVATPCSASASLPLSATASRLLACRWLGCPPRPCAAFQRIALPRLPALTAAGLLVAAPVGWAGWVC